MSQPLISIRALDRNHDPMWGNGHANFLNDIAAVAQIIQTNLLLFEGEWWENLDEGLPLFQNILGSNNGRYSDVIQLAIQNVILGVPFVTGITNVQCTYSTNRVFTYACLVTCQFGTITVNFAPGASAALGT